MFRELSEAGSGMPAEAGHRKRRIWECLFSTNLAPLPPPSPPTDRPHARAERPYTHTTLPTVYTRPTDRPNPPTPHRPTPTGLGDEYRKRRTWEPCSVLPMKQEGECRRGRAQKEEEQLCSGSTPIYYTILY